jgi:hypothetical protein
VNQVVLGVVLTHSLVVAADGGDATPTPDPKKLKATADRLFRGEKYSEVTGSACGRIVVCAFNDGCVAVAGCVQSSHSPGT